MNDSASTQAAPGIIITAVVERGRIKSGARMKEIIGPGGTLEIFSIVSPKTARKLRRKARKYGLADKHPHPTECLLAYIRHICSEGRSRAGISNPQMETEALP